MINSHLVTCCISETNNDSWLVEINTKIAFKFFFIVTCIVSGPSHFPPKWDTQCTHYIALWRVNLIIPAVERRSVCIVELHVAQWTMKETKNVRLQPVNRYGNKILHIRLLLAAPGDPLSVKTFSFHARVSRTVPDHASSDFALWGLIWICIINTTHSSYLTENGVWSFYLRYVMQHTTAYCSYIVFAKESNNAAVNNVFMVILCRHQQ
jgi:hypothetical protein